jgi:hypothetical protein
LVPNNPHNLFYVLKKLSPTNPYWLYVLERQAKAAQPPQTITPYNIYQQPQLHLLSL